MSDVEDRPLDRFMARRVGQIDDAYLTKSNLETTTHHHVSQEAVGTNDQSTHVGEIVETSTVELVAETRHLNEAPPFGQFVRVESDIPSIGLVFNTITHSVDPSRRPTAYGRSEAQLRSEQPQIFELLRTHFHILVIGYLDRAEPMLLLPPQPAHIHSFVYICNEKIIAQCTDGDEFLRGILRATKTPTEDLLVASVRYALAAREYDPDYIIQTSKRISRLLRDDYDRLSSVIERLARLIARKTD